MLKRPEKKTYKLIEQNPNPEFPIFIFPENIQNIILTLSETAQFETQITCSTLLFVVSTIIGNRIKIDVKKTWIDTPNIWVAVVGKPGTMKTPSMGFMLNPLKKSETEYNNTFQSELAEFFKIPKKERQDHLKPKRMQRYSNDPTVEGLITAMIHNTNGMGIYKDELNGFFEEMNRYNSGGNKEFYMSSFSGGQYIKNRASYDPITIDNIFLSILGSIQPELLTKLSQTNISNGMIDRWLYVESDNTIPMFSDNDVSIELVELYNSYIDSIDKWDAPEYLFWDLDAKEYFYGVVNGIGNIIQNDNTSEKLGTYLSKMRTYFARFVVIICALYKSQVISKIIVEFAESLTEYYINTAQNTFIGFNIETEIELIFQRTNSVTEKEKVLTLLRTFPDMKKTKIAEKCKCSRTTVYNFLKEV